ncbi:hypothetical protein [uncultured Tateyamaria sp.]|uniref:hypothetical protein n=1 Tax=uncultured Tateyamaria sp. TaxID=455651 RepID=UPI002605EF34|nr:hypothetical protein [uncultured Tateyamaria sp.]
METYSNRNAVALQTLNTGKEDCIMSDRKQVTIRAVKTVTYDRLREVKEASRIPLGALLDEAVEQWWHGLPEAEEA